jgi:hypothetical protein
MKTEEQIREEMFAEWFKRAEKYGRHIEASKVTKMSAEDLIKDLQDIPDQNKDFKVMYRYEGATPQRDFCVRMINLDKFYTKEEINILSFKGANKKFGHNKQNYSIWNYHGGSFCKHYWMEYAVHTDENGKIESAVAMGKAKGLAGQAASASNRFKTHPNGRFRNL